MFPSIFFRAVTAIRARALERKIDDCDEDIVVHGQCAMLAERRRDALELQLGALRHELARGRV